MYINNYNTNENDDRKKEEFNQQIYKLDKLKISNLSISAIDFLLDISDKINTVKNSLEVMYLKLVLFNNLGIFLDFIDENDKIKKQLDAFFNNTIYIAYFYFEETLLFDYRNKEIKSTLLILHFICEKSKLEKSEAFKKFNEFDIKPIFTVVKPEESVFVKEEIFLSLLNNMLIKSNIILDNNNINNFKDIYEHLYYLPQQSEELNQMTQYSRLKYEQVSYFAQVKLMYKRNERIMKLLFILKNQ